MQFRLTNSQRLVIEHIRNQYPISRAELTTLSGLTAGGLSKLIRELIGLGLIQEGKRVPVPRGQPRVPLTLNTDTVWSMGVSFSLHEIEVAAIDFAGQLIASRAAPLPSGGARAIFDQCGQMLDCLRLQVGAGRPEPCGAGVALPGYFNPDKPHTIRPPGPLMALADFDLSKLARLLGLPTFIENNSTAAALAEYYHRPQRALTSLTLINIGFGFSAGYVVNGQLYRGRDGNAGEIGRLYPRGTPRPSILDLLAVLQQRGTTISSSAALFAHCQHPDEALRGWVDRASEQLAHTISLIDHINAPADMVLGGQAPENLTEMLFVEVRERLGPNTPLRLSPLIPKAAVHGAAFLPLYQNFSPFVGPAN